MLTFCMINLIVLYPVSEYVHCCLIAAVREASVKINCLPASQFVHINYVISALSDSAGVVLLIHHCLMHKLLLTLRRLMSYMYMEHLFLMFLDHTQRRTTVGRTPLDE